MSGETLRDRNTPNWDLDYLDFPTAWWIQEEPGFQHLDPRCSAVQTAGAMLCDCGAVAAEWRRRRPPAADVHKPFTDDGVTYCGWDGHEGCGEVWPCSTVRTPHRSPLTHPAESTETSQS